MLNIRIRDFAVPDRVLGLARNSRWLYHPAEYQNGDYIGFEYPLSEQPVEVLSVLVLVISEPVFFPCTYLETCLHLALWGEIDPSKYTGVLIYSPWRLVPFTASSAASVGALFHANFLRMQICLYGGEVRNFSVHVEHLLYT